MLHKRYTDLPIYITENGSAWVDVLEDGCIHDTQRTDNLTRHLETISKMNDMGLNIAGFSAGNF